MSDKSGKKSGKFVRWALFVALIAGALFVVHTVYDKRKFSDSIAKNKIPKTPRRLNRGRQWCCQT